ncbi:MAG: KTSC domain-containing protein [Verrucomicrobia bacterium]|nr:KTSC domain-containing protein [Verrucomicrobiota bacterium]
MSALLPDKFVKMETVHDSEVIEQIGFVEISKRLYVKLRGGATPVCYENVPRFRYAGFLTAPRKDEYFKTYIKATYLSKPVAKLPGE